MWATGGWAADLALVTLGGSNASPWRKTTLTYPGGPSSHSLWGNTNRGCFWSISCLACACLFAPLFPWDYLHFSVLYREGFIQISASPSYHTALLHVSQENPMVSAAALDHPSRLPSPMEHSITAGQAPWRSPGNAAACCQLSLCQEPCTGRH